MKLINKNLIAVFIFMTFAPFVLASDFRDVNVSSFDEDENIAEEISVSENEEDEFIIEPAQIKQSAKAARMSETASHSSSISNYETINTAKDNNERLYGVVGKSQVISFDRSISRVSITDNKIADLIVLSSTQVLINGKKPGATSVIFWGDNDRPMFYNLVIQQNADNFLQAVEHVAPNENVSVIFNDEGAVLSGHLSSTVVKQRIADIAKAYKINLTDITESPAKQVLLEVKITEVSKNLSRSIGLDIVKGNHKNMLDLSGFKSGEWGPTGSNPLSGTYNIFQSGANGFLFGLWKDSNLGINFQASEGKGDIKVLAEPRLLAVNGEEGEFSIGNQVPVPSGMGQYGNISYDYKDTGVILKFTPTIMEDSNRVRLELSPEVSEVDDSVSVTSAAGAKVYGFKTRKVKTTVELNSGETLVIAGLLQNSSSRSRTQVPILGNIPIIGNLFATTKDDKRDTDLIIFITPKIFDNSVSLEHL